MEMSHFSSTNNSFCLDLFKTIFVDKSKENVFISPFSIAAAVAMTGLGAAADTAQGIVKALRWQPDEGNKMHEQFQVYLSSLKTKNDKYSLSLANRIYSQQNFKILQEFRESTAKYYLAEPVNADFVNASEAECTKINTWVSEQTEDKIKDLIPPGVLDALTRMVIVNAIYFKGNWDLQFDEKRTESQKFKIAGDQTKSVPMMYAKRKFHVGQSDKLKCRALELPYKGKDLSMVVILPDQDFGLQNLVGSLSQSEIDELLSSLKPANTDVALWLPKFEVTSSHSLKEALSALGMADAFSMESANFSGITGNKDLYITAAIHKAFIKVNEEGTEAAAATAMTFGLRCMPMNPIPPFTVDHPFLYLIRDNRANGLILFIGAVADPSL
ncbi:hypothetical protein EGW08_010311 [Elysia chlorotica]|uniref:Serpin domain-containing protein n=1 Tax=Elysia chlorotica TaxID=188477 RepID=A0A433TK91_ELYCH|nr:hypothetical protein EGW08_010311 [Elysia chlorotica]